MALFWYSILVLFAYCVRSENIESNDPKTSKRDESFSSQFGYETNPHSQHSQQSSSLMFNNNGYNQNQPNVQESSSAQTYSSGDQNNGQFDKKDQKTIILAIPVKLALQSPGQQNYETSPVQPAVQPTHPPHSYSNYSPSYSTQSHPNPQPSAISATSYASDKNNQNSNYQTSVVSQQHQSLAPLSQKIYSTISYPQYSTGHVSPQQSNNNNGYNSNPSYSNSNGQQYKTASDLNLNEGKDYRLNRDKYGKNDNYRSNERDEYKADSNVGADDYGGNKYWNTHNSDIKYDDSNEEKSLHNLKESPKSLYDSDSKLEYDYDSNTDSDHKFDEYDNIRTKESQNSRDYNHKTGHYLINNNRNSGESFPHKERPSNTNNNNYYPSNDESQYTIANNQDFDEGFNHDNYETIKSNANNWPQIYDTINGNQFRSLNARGIRNKERARNPFYSSSLSDMFGDSLIKAASAPIRYKPSKIYGSAPSHQPSSSSAPYQPLSLFAGFGRDYGTVDINGDLYPAPLVNNHPPRKLYKPLNYEGNKFLEFGDYMNSDFLKLNQRSPSPKRPNFMSGLRPSKPLANYSPFASASTTSSFLSSIPGIHTINKSFPTRQLFPALYG